MAHLMSVSLKWRRTGYRMDLWDPERPQLAWLARLGDTHPPQRSRPIPSGAQPPGELVQELIDPEALHVVDRYAIDTGRAPVSTDLPPRPAHDVAAGDLVKQGMKTAIPTLLGTALQHALESANPIHTQGVADRPSRYGTHQVPLILPVHR
jgi:hypothetical protein